MNRVIRTARISEHTVVLPVQVDPDMLELPEIDEDGAEVTGFTPLGEQAEVILDDEVVNPEEPEVDVEALVEERLQEAEARFQQEKEEAVQASFEEGRAQGAAEGHAQGMEEGRAQGDQDGYARGLTEGLAQSNGEIEHFQALLIAFGEKWGDLFKTADRDMTELAMAIARNVVGGLVDGNETIVLDAVQDCLTHVQDRARVVIRVNPDDLAVVRNHREEWQQAFEQIESLMIEADETIGQGGCMVETPAGDIDAQIESRLDKLRTALMEAVQNAPVENAPVMEVEEEVESAGDEALLPAEISAEQDQTAPDVAEESDLEVEGSVENIEQNVVEESAEELERDEMEDQLEDSAVMEEDEKENEETDIVEEDNAEDEGEVFQQGLESELVESENEAPEEVEMAETVGEDVEAEQTETGLENLVDEISSEEALDVGTAEENTVDENPDAVDGVQDFETDENDEESEEGSNLV